MNGAVLVIKVEQEGDSLDQKGDSSGPREGPAALCAVSRPPGRYAGHTGHCSVTAGTSLGANTAPQVGTSSRPVLLPQSGGERAGTSWPRTAQELGTDPSGTPWGSRQLPRATCWPKCRTDRGHSCREDARWLLVRGEAPLDVRLPTHSVVPCAPEAAVSARIQPLS